MLFQIHVCCSWVRKTLLGPSEGLNTLEEERTSKTKPNILLFIKIKQMNEKMRADLQLSSTQMQIAALYITQIYQMT